MKKNLKVAKILNELVFILTAISFIWMFSGFSLISKGALSNPGIEVFKYFTVDSNLFVGVISLIYVLYLKKGDIPMILKVLKLSSVASVFLTFFITAVYLAPLFGKDFLLLYVNSNFFFHFFIPLLSFVSFVFFEEKYDIKGKNLLLSVIPVILYECFYIINICIHSKGMTINKDYDFYGFTGGSFSSIFIIGPLMLLIMFIISLSIIKLNNKIQR